MTGRYGCGLPATSCMTGSPLHSSPLAMLCGCGCSPWRPGPERSCMLATPGVKPANMDVENLLLYNIDPTVGGCFRPGARHGVRFELAAGPRRDPPSGRALRLLLPVPADQPGQQPEPLAARAPAGKLHRSRSGAVPVGQAAGTGMARHPPRRRRDRRRASRACGAVRGLPHSRLSAHQDRERRPRIDQGAHRGTVAAFQAHGDGVALTEAAARLAGGTGQPASLIARALLDDRRAVLGMTDRLVHLRGSGVQWNPADHLCMAGQVRRPRR